VADLIGLNLVKSCSTSDEIDYEDAVHVDEKISLTLMPLIWANLLYRLQSNGLVYGGKSI